ncbi:beta-sandwich lipoprotein, partial [Lactiplantibacillus argentoratensis]
EKKLTVTCKIGKDKYKKHYLGLSDNVSYFVEQTDAKYENAYHYKVLFRPEQIVPDIELQTSKGK